MGILIPISMMIFGFTALSCSSDGEEESSSSSSSSIDVDFTLPSTMDVASQGSYTFTVNDGKAPLTTDKLYFKDESGISYSCSITSTSSESFTITLANGIVTGTYEVSVKRDSDKKTIGSTYVNIVEELDFEPDASSTVYGQVTCNGNPISGVVMSDGINVTVTDDDGIYEMASDKEYGYVFMSVPSGYVAEADGTFPQIYYQFKGSASDVERADFSLTKVNGQDSYTLLILGDMHLANRTNDKLQFADFVDDINDYISANKSSSLLYGLTLGDMTWDLYWYKNDFDLGDYKDYINDQISGIQIYNTMGNHDNDYLTYNDLDAAAAYIYYIAPPFYSFNIGQVHYVVLDDIDCSAYDGTTDRNYSKGVSDDQLEWLAKDLAYVDTSTPVVVATHAQIFYPSTTSSFKIDHDATNTASLFSVLSDYDVHFFTGHTHECFNVTPTQSSSLGATDTYEHNAGSICASWWWSGYKTEGVHIAPDGAPGGYTIFKVNGTDFTWQYKATGSDVDYQFRSYDLNNVAFGLDDVPNMPSTSSIVKAFTKYITAYPGQSDNKVLINIWNWSTDWSLEVTDGDGNSLSWTQSFAYDPLHILALSIPRFNSSTIKSTPNFVTDNDMCHFFTVTAPNASSTLTIKVTDPFGNVYTETMTRPKEFSVDTYKK